eukprot:g48.t1
MPNSKRKNKKKKKRSGSGGKSSVDALMYNDATETTAPSLPVVSSSNSPSPNLPPSATSVKSNTSSTMISESHPSYLPEKMSPFLYAFLRGLTTHVDPSASSLKKCPVVINTANLLKTQGNANFNKQDYPEAAGRYDKAIHILRKGIGSRIANDDTLAKLRTISENKAGNNKNSETLELETKARFDNQLVYLQLNTNRAVALLKHGSKEALLDLIRSLNFCMEELLTSNANPNIYFETAAVGTTGTSTKKTMMSENDLNESFLHKNFPKELLMKPCLQKIFFLRARARMQLCEANDEKISSKKHSKELESQLAKAYADLQWAVKCATHAQRMIEAQSSKKSKKEAISNARNLKKNQDTMEKCQLLLRQQRLRNRKSENQKSSPKDNPIDDNPRTGDRTDVKTNAKANARTGEGKNANPNPASIVTELKESNNYTKKMKKAKEQSLRDPKRTRKVLVSFTHSQDERPLSTNPALTPEPRSMTPNDPDETDATTTTPITTPLPSLRAPNFSTQQRILKVLLEQSNRLGLQSGEIYGIVSLQWWQRWIQASQTSQTSQTAQTSQAIGPISNSDITITSTDNSTSLSLLYTLDDSSIIQGLSIALKPSYTEFVVPSSVSTRYHEKSPETTVIALPWQCYIALIDWYGTSAESIVCRKVNTKGILSQKASGEDLTPEIPEEDGLSTSTSDELVEKKGEVVINENLEGNAESQLPSQPVSCAVTDSYLMKLRSELIDSNKYCHSCYSRAVHTRCIRCRCAFYCAKGCQRQHWNPTHKSLCKHLKRSYEKTKEEFMYNLSETKNGTTRPVVAAPKDSIIGILRDLPTDATIWQQSGIDRDEILDLIIRQHAVNECSKVIKAAPWSDTRSIRSTTMAEEYDDSDEDSSEQEEENASYNEGNGHHEEKKGDRKLVINLFRTLLKRQKRIEFAFSRKGKVGLYQLGNTCFLNSALQALSHAEPLRRLFLRGDAVKSINPDNTFGTGGLLTKAYSELYQHLWHGDESAIAPSLVKRRVALKATRFGGYEQQDASEFLTYFLDALHEDMNAVTKKPYCEDPEGGDNGRPDSEVALDMQKVFRSRENSPLVKLFYIQTRQKISCPNEDCGRVQIKFPFEHLYRLNFPQPMKDIRIYLLRLPANRTESKPIYEHFTVKMPAMPPSNASSKMYLLPELERQTGIPESRLYIADVYQGKLYLPSKRAYKLNDDPFKDFLVAYELCAPRFGWQGQQDSDGGQANSSSNSSSSPVGAALTQEMGEGKDSNVQEKERDGKIGESSESIYTPLTLAHEPYVPFQCFVYLTFRSLPAPSSHEINDSSIPENGETKTAFHDDEDDTSAWRTASSRRSNIGKSRIPSTFSAEEDKRASYEKFAEDSIPLYLSFDPDTFTTKDLYELIKQETAKLCFLPGVEFSEGQDLSPKSITKNEFLLDDSEYQLSLFSIQRVWDRTKIRSRGDLYIPADETKPGSAVRFLLDSKYQEFCADRKNHKIDFGQRYILARWRLKEGAGSSLGAPIQEQITYAGQRKKQLLFVEKSWSEEQIQNHLVNPVSSSTVDVIQRQESSEMESIATSQESTSSSLSTIDEKIAASRTWTSLLQLRESSVKFYHKAIVESRNGQTRRVLQLEELFAESYKATQLDEDNKWYCNRCKDHVRAFEERKIYAAPEILMIQLKRFKFVNMIFSQKIKDYVNFEETLTVEQDGEKIPYRLFAVINHHGGYGAGHYTCFGRDLSSLGERNWYLYDDSSVTLVEDPRRIVTRDAYILFYQRKKSTPLCQVIETSV